MKLLRHLALPFAITVTEVALPAQNPEPAPTEEKTNAALAHDSVSVDFAGDELETIITQIGRLFRLKLQLPAGGLAGRTSVKLRDVTWRQIFAVTLKPAGYDFYELDGVVFILPQDEFERLPAQTRTTELYYQTPDEAAQYLRDLYAAHATFSATPTGVAYSAHPKHLFTIAQEIARMDSPNVRLNPFPRPVFFPRTLPKLSPTTNRLGGEHPRVGDDPAATRVLVLRKVSSSAASEYLRRQFASHTLRIITDRRINSMVITAPDSQMPRIEAAAAYLDDERWYHPENAEAASQKDELPVSPNRP